MAGPARNLGGATGPKRVSIERGCGVGRRSSPCAMAVNRATSGVCRIVGGIGSVRASEIASAGRKDGGGWTGIEVPGGEEVLGNQMALVAGDLRADSVFGF